MNRTVRHQSMTIETSRRAGRGAQIARLFCCLFRHRQRLFDSRTVFFSSWCGYGWSLFSNEIRRSAPKPRRVNFFVFLFRVSVSPLPSPPPPPPPPPPPSFFLRFQFKPYTNWVPPNKKERRVVVLFVVRPCHCVGNLLVCLWW